MRQPQKNAKKIIYNGHQITIIREVVATTKLGNKAVQMKANTSGIKKSDKVLDYSKF